MTEIKKCQRCGTVIGDAYNTDYYAYIRMKYCPECKKTVTNIQAAERMKKFRHKNRMMNKAMKDRVQLLEQENELLRQRIIQLRELVEC